MHITRGIGMFVFYKNNHYKSVMHVPTLTQTRLQHKGKDPPNYTPCLPQAQSKAYTCEHQARFFNLV